MNYEQKLVEQFTFVILLSTLTAVLPYFVCAIVNFRMLLRDRKSLDKKVYLTKLISAIVAILFSFWIIVNMGITTIIWGFVLLIAAVPFYLFIHQKPVPLADKS